MEFIDQELRRIEGITSNDEYLNALAATALRPECTAPIFTTYESLCPEICARWIYSDLPSKATATAVLAAFARILPHARYLQVLAEHLVPGSRRLADAVVHKDPAYQYISSQGVLSLDDVCGSELQSFLLAVFRLLQFDRRTFAKLVSPLRLQSLFSHERCDVAYLAVRVFCLYVQAGDGLTQDMILKTVGDGVVMGQWEGRMINYWFLLLWEEKLVHDMKMWLNRSSSLASTNSRRPRREDSSPWTGNVGGVLLPRVSLSDSRPSAFVFTQTATENARAFAKSLKSSAPIFVTGPSGSGKTALVNHVAQELGADKGMLTLHLNAQTDAKTLIGMYTMGTEPGKFTWQSGILSTAVREGRWVLIEDLDRAPADVLEVLLPLLSDRKLVLPNRGETIHAASSFRVIATVRTAGKDSGEAHLPSSLRSDDNLWTRVHVRVPDLIECREIVASRFPILHTFIPTIINVYARIQALYTDERTRLGNGASLGRLVTLRDLLRWCRRLDYLLRRVGARTGSEALPEGTAFDVFAEATDNFLGYQQSGSVREVFIRAIGQELQLSPQQLDYFSRLYTPRYEAIQTCLKVGRAHLAKKGTAGMPRRHGQIWQNHSFLPTKQTLRTLEQIGAAIQQSESVLLVGETGTGKTALVQHLAEALGHRLVTVNLSQQSEAGDLLGSFKPVNIKSLMAPMNEDFESIFPLTFPADKNDRYLDTLRRCFRKEAWTRILTLWQEALTMADGILQSHSPKSVSNPDMEPRRRTKKRKMNASTKDLLKPRWEKFRDDLKAVEKYLSGNSKAFAFKFVEGSVIRAARHGDWLLLDEINLASPDVLEGLADLLSDESGGTRFVVLSESGEADKIEAHPDFRIFGAMNPATDIGKRDLPLGLRSRFFELYVEGPDKDFNDLVQVVKAWLGQLTHQDNRLASDIARFYLATKALLQQNRLADNVNGRPHFSLRTLTRTLSYVTEFASSYGIRRAMLEAFSMSFLTHLDRESQQLLLPLIGKHIIGEGRTAKSLLKQTPRLPSDGTQYVQFESYWMPRGDSEIEQQQSYIITKSIRQNLLNLIRATSTRRFPVLIQGPTSSGKTSMIAYLAKATGNKLVRINNHEHTDVQEYIGTYASDTEGQLHFQEGILVRALREGHWIVLDELNLAPTDILEALNRLLDENRELLIPETQEVVKPHANFLLFATQNPAGLYGGRKFLSRAFRNRFIELYFGDIPEEELETILQQRTQIAPSYAANIVKVYKELLLLRQSDRLFEHRNSFVTLRDLFRWASRKAENRGQLAMDGFMLVAERIRRPQEKLEIKRIIERAFKTTIDEDRLYSDSCIAEVEDRPPKLIWTKAMRRLHHLVYGALKHDEPVLLVGETGCGKTSICQVLAAALGKKIHIVNAQQNTETGDIIGSQRPVRNRSAAEGQLGRDLLTVFTQYLGSTASPVPEVEALVAAYNSLDQEQIGRIPLDLRDRIGLNRLRSKALFEWSDGALVQAMKNGEFFLLDEISLADDSVLERLNSVLEPERTLLLAEKGTNDSLVQATEGFQFLATMNPGGDFGKRELSPALRNRFTEIWVPPLSDEVDVIQIVRATLLPSAAHLSEAIVSFARWFSETFSTAAESSISLRHVLAWVEFINRCSFLDLQSAYLHGAALVFIDTLGANPAALTTSSPDFSVRATMRCLESLGKHLHYDFSSLYYEEVNLSMTSDSLTIGRFSLRRMQLPDIGSDFQFQAPTSRRNAMRVVRAMQLPKPILLEGSPGVGKTTLVAALANLLGSSLTRINLSEQTDLMDFFGSDVPVEGAQVGLFAWKEGPFLQAMRNGHWVLLDEMNLASQSVLEGLNSCFDHRGEVYVSELNLAFKRHPDFRVFATQNPHFQGSGRKGLPMSFVNRFSVVYADEYSEEDLTWICKELYPTYPLLEMAPLVKYMRLMYDKVVRRRDFGSQGGPWDFNLRDIARWLQLLTSQQSLLPAGNAADFLPLVISQRFRTQADRDAAHSLFAECYGAAQRSPYTFQNLGSGFWQAGLGLVPRDQTTGVVEGSAPEGLRHQQAVLQSIVICIHQNWPCILVGKAGSGKSRLIRYVASIMGASLVELPLNSGFDTMDFVGSYEQVDSRRQARILAEKVEGFIRSQVHKFAAGDLPQEALTLFEHLQSRRGDREYLQTLYADLSALDAQLPSTQLSAYREECEELLEVPEAISAARFEWIDGPLVKALEQGTWVILRNANLCSSSVLDRLNSLLEPNGRLIINEHQNANGMPTTIKPHPNFRVFLTVDPRHGELSRPMRNRSVELYFEHDGNTQVRSRFVELPAAESDSGLSRYRYLTGLCRESHPEAWSMGLLEAAFIRLALSDLTIFDSWCRELFHGLVDLPHKKRHAFDVALEKLKRLRSTSVDFEGLRLAYLDLGRSCHDLPEGFIETQPIDAVQNQSLLSLSGDQSIKDALTSCVSVYDLVLDTFQMEREHELRGWSSRDLGNGPWPPARQNQLGSGLATFLHDIHQEIFQWAVSAHARSMSRADVASFVRNIIACWYWTLEMASRPQCDRATFQTLLQIWKTLAATSGGGSDEGHNLSQRVGICMQKLGSSWMLETGFSMERLWVMFRPTTPRTLERLNTMLQLENFASRFDSLTWRIRQPLKDIMHLRASIQETIWKLLVEDVNGIVPVQHLQAAIESLEARSDGVFSWESPFFQDEFEGLCQYYDLLSPEWIRGLRDVPVGVVSTASLLAKRPSMTRDYSPLPGPNQIPTVPPSSLLARLVNYTGIDSDNRQRYLPLRATIVPRLLSKLMSASSVPLRNLEFLVLETEELGQLMGRSASVVASSPVDTISAHLIAIASALFDAHSECCTESQRTWIHGLRGACLPEQVASRYRESSLSTQGNQASQDKLFQLVATHYLVPSLNAIRECQQGKHEEVKFAAACILFAIGCLTLYVPNQPYDPSLRESCEADMHQRRKEIITAKLEAARQVERAFTGQSTNPRCEILEEELRMVGDHRSQVLVCRPNESELETLQVDFDNILNALVRPLQGSFVVEELLSGRGQAQQEVQTLRSNLSQVAARLSSGYRAYDDITSPVVGFLGCLDLGLFLASLHLSKLGDSEVMSVPMFFPIPYLSATPQSFRAHLSSSSQTIENLSLDWRLSYLQGMSILVGVEGLQALDEQQRRNLASVFHSVYNGWKRQVEADQEEATASSRLYRYRGDVDGDHADTDEGIKELFPNKDDPEPPRNSSDSKTSALQSLTSKLARLHTLIFLEASHAPDRILDGLTAAAQTAGTSPESVATVAGTRSRTEELMPSLILSLDQMKSSLQPAPPSLGIYDFYRDGNIQESRKLMELIRGVHARFSDLRDRWPEHATLQDVLDTLEELSAFGHRDPLAKMLTKAEKLYGYMYEWQQVASKEFSAAHLLTELTSLLVSWRRLELQSWSRLFDMEEQKSEEQARSWWFMAYEAVIAMPLSQINAGKKLGSAIENIISVIDSFFVTASLGQYLTRLHILRELERHAYLISKDSIFMEQIHRSLHNVIGFYRSFDPLIRSVLSERKQALEKEIREVIVLASWKDTNINALRESARRSHQRLFKVVRKYRALLAEPVRGLIAKGLPPAPLPPDEEFHQPSFSSSWAMDARAVALCQMLIPDWSERPRVWMNASSAQALNHELATNISRWTASVPVVEGFASELIRSMKTLQDQTPATLTDENSATVKHLKTRKRKLFAETLRTLRQMGFQHNLGADLLAAQRSSPLIFGRMELLHGVEGLSEHATVDIYFYMFLDLVQRSRQAMHEPSQELTPAEIARSTGFLEGILHELLKQRKTLTTTLSQSSTLRDVLQTLRTLWAPGRYRLLPASGQTLSRLEESKKRLNWLPNIIEVGIRIFVAHTRVADMKDPGIVEYLSEWKQRLERLSERWYSLPGVPGGLTTAQIQLQDETDACLAELVTSLRHMSDEHLVVGYLFKQILPWALPFDVGSMDNMEASHNNGVNSVGLRQVGEKITDTCDSINVMLADLGRNSGVRNPSQHDVGWLVKHGEQLAATLLHLNPSHITLEIQAALGQLRHLTEDDLNAAAALFAVALPALEQYTNVVAALVQSYSAMHRSTCKLGNVLARSLHQLLAQGFCTPSDSAGAQNGEGGRADTGTGLGEGEGAEDISRDIRDDESLTDIAQEPNLGDDKRELEAEKDAVQMADEMDGQDGNASEAADEEDNPGSEVSEVDVDEKVDNVDDLDPSTVDEKFLDGKDKADGKDQRTEQSQGKGRTGEELEAAKADAQDSKEDDEADPDATGVDEAEEIAQNEPQQQDPYVQQENSLELPEDMKLDGEKQTPESDGEEDLDDLGSIISEAEVDPMEVQSDADVPTDEGHDVETGVESEEDQSRDVQDGDPEYPAAAPDPNKNEVSEDIQDLSIQDVNDAAADTEHPVSDEAEGTGYDPNQTDAAENQVAGKRSQHPDNSGTAGKHGGAQPDQAAENNDSELQTHRDAAGEGQRPEKSHSEAQTEAFRKLGNILERWQRQARQIQGASEAPKDNRELVTQPSDHAELEHLHDDNDTSDAQALGAATEEQARALDQSGVMEGVEDHPDEFLPDEAPTDTPSTGEANDLMDVDESRMSPEHSADTGGQQESRAVIGQPQELDAGLLQLREDSDEAMEGVDHEEDTPAATPLTTRSIDDAQSLWTRYENDTRHLSLALTEQLRLILNPTVASKMRGDFRTGKRLNIKRIIPYIASQYKRDKIWMRRSVPSKRHYQIMLAVDDSKSMAEGGAGQLALETLAMVARSLAMLEVGQICVVAFGQDVRVAHEFEQPFHAAAGPAVFRHFSFQQTRTDVKALLNTSLPLFRSARANNASSSSSSSSQGGGDPWQLQLIISDGICEDHASIRRLVRQAKEERIMIVFVIVDDVGRASGTGKGRSILEMTQAIFENDDEDAPLSSRGTGSSGDGGGGGAMKVRMQRYLDTFPFSYYLVVGDVQALPGVLATALRQWFKEVVDAE